MAYIYKIVNKTNNKIYIGATTRTIDDRIDEHLYDATRFPNRKLYKALNKYGASNFETHEIEYCDDSVRFDRESFWIDYYGSYIDGYNETRGGSGKPVYSYDEILNMLKEQYSAAEIVNKLRCCIDTVSLVAKNNGIDLRHIQGKHQFKPVVRTDKNGDKLIYDCLSAAARDMDSNGVLRSCVKLHIVQCCRKERKYAYGFSWDFLSSHGTTQTVVVS